MSEPLREQLTPVRCHVLDELVAIFERLQRQQMSTGQVVHVYVITDTGSIRIAHHSPYSGCRAYGRRESIQKSLADYPTSDGT